MRQRRDSPNRKPINITSNSITSENTPPQTIENNTKRRYRARILISCTAMSHPIAAGETKTRLVAVVSRQLSGCGVIKRSYLGRKNFNVFTVKLGQGQV